MSDETTFSQAFATLDKDKEQSDEDRQRTLEAEAAQQEEEQTPVIAPDDVQGGGEQALDPAPVPEAPVPPAPPSEAAEAAGAPDRESAVAGEGLSSEDTSALDYAGDAFRQILGGGSDALENIANAGKETFFGETRDKFGNIVKTFDFPDVGAPVTTAGEIIRPISEFLLPFIATAGMVGVAAKSFQLLNFLRSGSVVRNSLLQGSIAGAITDYAALDPEDGNLSTMLNDIPEAANFVPDVFIHNESDSQFEKRMKSVVEGAVIGASAEMLFHGFRLLRMKKKTARFHTAYGTDKEPKELARISVSNLVQARRVYQNVEVIRDAIKALGEKDPAFSEALSYLESVERVPTPGAPQRPKRSAVTPEPEDYDNLSDYNKALDEYNKSYQQSDHSNAIDREYDNLSPEAKAFVDSSETLKSQYDLPSRKQALETHYNSLGVDSPLSQSSLTALENSAGAQGKEIAGLIRALGAGNMDDYLEQAGKHLADQEAAYDRLIGRGTPGEILFGPQVVRQMQSEVDAAYPRGYTNEISKKFDDGTPRTGVRVVLAKDPLWDGKAPPTARNLASRLTSEELVEFSKRVAEGDINAIHQYLAGITREGHPAGFDSIFRKYEDLGSAELLDEFSTILRNASQHSPAYRTQSLKFIGFAAKDLAKKTIHQIQRDFENVATSLGAGKRALADMIDIDPDNPISAYEQLAVKVQAMRLVQQHTMRSIAELPSKDNRSHKEAARAILMLNELRDLVTGSRTVIRETGRSLRAQALSVEDLYLEITAELGGFNKANDYLDLIALRGGGKIDGNEMRQINLTLRKTTRKMRTEAAVQFWLGAILSAPTTQAVNVASNTVATLWYQTEQVVGAMVPRLANVTANPATWRKEVAAMAERVSDELYAFSMIKTGVSKSFHINTAAKQKLWQAYKTGDFEKIAEEMARPENQELGFFWSSLFSNRPAMDASSKFDLGGSSNAMTMDKLAPNTSQDSTWGKTLGATLAALNAVPSASFRLLMANDAWSKSVNYQMKVGTWARKHARERLQAAESKGLADEALPDDTLGKFTKKDAEELRKDIEANSFNWDSDEFTPETGRVDTLRQAHEEGTRYSQYATHTEAQEFSTVSRWLQNQTQVTPELKFALPFINTPTNLIRAVRERTPIAWKSAGRYKKAMAEGDTDTLHAMKARMRMGSMLWLSAGALAVEGRITGGAPRDAEERERWLLVGKPEYAVWFKIPYASLPEGSRKWWVQDKENPEISWLSFARLEPLSTIFKMAADITESVGDINNGDMTEIGAVLGSAVSDNILSQSYFEGISRIVGLFQNPERETIGGDIEDLVASFIPNILMKGRQTWVDDGMKEANTLYEKALNRSPWAGELINKTNVFNEPRVYPRGWGQFVNPFYSGDWVRDEVAEALDEAEYSVSQRKVYGSIRSIKLPPKLVRDYKMFTNSITISGRTLKEHLHLLIQTQSFNDAGTTVDNMQGGKHELIDRVFDKYKAAAARIISERPWFKERENVKRLLEAGLKKETVLSPGLMTLLDQSRRDLDAIADP